MEQALLLHDGMTFVLFFLLSVVISYYAIPVITRIAEKKHLFDHPDDERKLHKKATPALGGVAIFFAFLLSFSLSPWADAMEGYSFLVGALLILFLVGLKDDLIELSAHKKLMAQFAAAGLVIWGSGIQITDFHGVLGLAEIPAWAGVPLSFFSIIVVINAVNLIDGIDGLAGGIGVIASVLFGSAFLYVGQLPMAMFSLCLAGALLGFLYYNFSPATIFMGDTGSMILGFLLGVQAIEFIGLSNQAAFSGLFGNAAPILAVSIMAFPLFDTLRVVFKRLRRNKSIFEPGRDHVHHELLRMGLSHKKASLLLYIESLLLISIVVSFALFKIDVNLLLGLLLVTSLLVYPTNGFKRELVAKVFGYRWQIQQRRMWGVQLDYHKLVSLVEKQENGESGNDLSEQREEREEAPERIAI